MVLRGVGAGDQDDLRLFDVPDGVGHGTASERCGQTGHSGRVSETRAVIDIVGSDHRPCEFLGKVVFLVGDSRAAQNPDRIRPRAAS